MGDRAPELLLLALHGLTPSNRGSSISIYLSRPGGPDGNCTSHQASRGYFAQPSLAPRTRIISYLPGDVLITLSSERLGGTSRHRTASMRHDVTRPTGQSHHIDTADRALAEPRVKDNRGSDVHRIGDRVKTQSHFHASVLVSSATHALGP